MKKLAALTILAIFCLAYTSMLIPRVDKPVTIPASPQRSGDPDKGYTYLTTGDYLKSGIPYGFFLLGFGKARTNYLNRTGLNAAISHEYTAVQAPNGEMVVAPNCLQCHAQVFDGKLYIGLGNTFADFTSSARLDPKPVMMTRDFLKKGDPKKFEAAEPFLKAMIAISGELHTEVRGVNAADRLAALLVAHRDPNTLRWNDSATLSVPEQVIPSDVPPWWLLKKKHGMFYNGFGRGDFGRFLMASNLLTVNDSSESREVDSHFNDVLAYLYTLTPPAYPRPVDQGLVRQGATIFAKNCSKCHGSYGDGGEYPNLLIPESIIKTDSLLFKANYQSPQFVNWFNNSWFAQGDHPARLEPYDGYIAPPLDGIWVTAPYLHNGSVPTLEALLDSRLRPKYWSRDFDKPEYDYDQVGWKYTTEAAAGGNKVYNTTLPGYGNYGHTFGDKLSNKERKSLIEFLKTL